MTQIAQVSKYVGLPHRSDFKCWDLVKLIYKEILGIDLLDLGKDLPIEEYRKQWQRVNSPTAWDIVHFKIDGEQHAGVILKKGNFIHCVAAGVVINNVSDKIWKPRIVGFYRYRNDNA